MDNTAASTTSNEDTKTISLNNESQQEKSIALPENLPSSIQNKNKKEKTQMVGENYERMNYLLQVSKYISKRRDKERYGNAGASLGSLAMAIGRKCLLRVDPCLKRQVCKGCGSALTPGVSSKYRLKNKGQKHLLVTCSTCKTIKRFVTNPDYLLWSEKPEALVV